MIELFYILLIAGLIFVIWGIIDAINQIKRIK